MMNRKILEGELSTPQRGEKKAPLEVHAPGQGVAADEDARVRGAEAHAHLARSHSSDQHLRRARSRLYRSEILQENMRWKALAEIYTMHSFAQLYNIIFSKIVRNVATFCKNQQIYQEPILLT